MVSQRVGMPLVLLLAYDQAGTKQCKVQCHALAAALPPRLNFALGWDMLRTCAAGDGGALPVCGIAEDEASRRL